MDESDRRRDLRLLAEGRDAVFEAVRDLSEEDAARSPGEGRWSVLECLEHICVSEDNFYEALLTRIPRVEEPGRRDREEEIIQGAPLRQERITAPERLRPTGRFASLADAVEHFSRSRARTIEYVERCDRDLRLYRAKHPTFGEITGEEFLIIIALHPARHANQILETREALRPSSANKRGA
ncbi:MAG TPA: DinB family protein [Verrucomicrobiae bacterium]|nr:DinB family protein [Verrucomicrobiae bacterium]